jgi:hypothetical protein
MMPSTTGVAHCEAAVFIGSVVLAGADLLKATALAAAPTPRVRRPRLKPTRNWQKNRTALREGKRRQARPGGIPMNRIDGLD